MIMLLFLVCTILLKCFNSQSTIVIGNGNRYSDEYTCTNADCANNYIICERNRGCTIKCDSTNACENTIILSDNELIVDCTHEDGCSNTEVYCGDLSLAASDQISFPSDSYDSDDFRVNPSDSLSCEIQTSTSNAWTGGTFGCYGDGISTCTLYANNDNSVSGTTTFICNTEWSSSG